MLVNAFFPTFKFHPLTFVFFFGFFIPKQIRQLAQHLFLRLQRSKIKFALDQGPVRVEVQTDPPEKPAETSHESDADQEDPPKSMPRSPTASAQSFAADQRLLWLAEDFNNIRRTQPTGKGRTLAVADRTKQMTRIVPSLSEANLRACLCSKRGEQRILAYVFLTKSPNGGSLVDVAKCLQSVDQNPFDQRWCVEIIFRILDKEPSRLNITTLNVLRKCLPSLPVGTTRRSRLLTLIDAIENRQHTAENDGAVNDAMMT